jgi:hypothetical protein
MRWRSVSVTASSVLLLAGCGGGQHHAQPPPKPPRIPAAVASRLAAEADRVAALAPGSCAARDAARRFQSDVIASIRRVPARYQEPLSSAANDLTARLAACTEPPPPPRPHPHEQEKPKHHGKRKHEKGGKP